MTPAQELYGFLEAFCEMALMEGGIDKIRRFNELVPKADALLARHSEEAGPR